VVFVDFHIGVVEALIEKARTLQIREVDELRVIQRELHHIFVISCERKVFLLIALLFVNVDLALIKIYSYGINL